MRIGKTGVRGGGSLRKENCDDFQKLLGGGARDSSNEDKGVCRKEKTGALNQPENIKKNAGWRILIRGGGGDARSDSHHKD